MGSTNPAEDSAQRLQLPECNADRGVERQHRHTGGTLLDGHGQPSWCAFSCHSNVTSVVTVELERRGQFHQGDVVVEAFGSVLGVVNDPLHGHGLGAVDRLLRHAHVDRPHGGVGEASGAGGQVKHAHANASVHAHANAHANANGLLTRRRSAPQ